MFTLALVAPEEHPLRQIIQAKVIQANAQPDLSDWQKWKLESLRLKLSSRGTSPRMGAFRNALGVLEKQNWTQFDHVLISRGKYYPVTTYTLTLCGHC